MLRSTVLSLSSDIAFVDVRHWSSNDEFMAYLERQDRQVVIGDDAQSADQYLTLSVSARKPMRVDVGVVGVVCDSYSLVPKVAIEPSWNSILIAVNKIFVSVDVETFASASIDFDSPIHDLILTNSGPVVQTEIGVVAPGRSGQRRWEHEHDLLDAVELDGDSLDVRFQDGTAVRVDVASGRLERR